MFIRAFGVDEYGESIKTWHDAHGGVTTAALLCALGLSAAGLVLFVRRQATTRPYQLAVEYGERTWHDLSDRLVGILLAVPWVWMGCTYFLGDVGLSPHVGPLGVTAATITFAQAVFIAFLPWLSAATSVGLSWRIQAKNNWVTHIGVATVLYAVLGHPLVATLAGRSFPKAATIGMPTPTCLLFLGMLLLTDGSGVPLPVILAPLGWAIVWAPTMFKLGLREDYPLLFVTAFTGLYLTVTQPYTPHGDPEALAKAHKLRMKQAQRRVDRGKAKQK